MVANDCYRKSLVEKMRAGPYALFTDGSNDNGLKKMMPLSIAVLEESGVKVHFLDMGLIERTTAECKFSSKAWEICVVYRWIWSSSSTTWYIKHVFNSDLSYVDTIIVIDNISIFTAMFNMISSTLRDNDIPIENCVAVALDNTNSNMGAHNSLKTRMQGANPSIYVVGCVCHMLHNAGQHGIHTLEVSFWFQIKLHSLMHSEAWNCPS